MPSEINLNYSDYFEKPTVNRVIRSKHQVLTADQLIPGNFYCKMRVSPDGRIRLNLECIARFKVLEAANYSRQGSKKPGRVFAEIYGNRFDLLRKGNILLEDIGIEPGVFGWNSSCFTIPQDYLETVLMHYRNC